jgi:hypothetical protein
MSNRRRDCDDKHRFQEHGIGAGLTRKICVLCGALEIGEGRRAVLVEDPWVERPLPVSARAS